MDFTLTPEELRITGALMEKQMATPDYYPLSLPSLVQACNQKSSRNPVVQYTEEQVLSSINDLYGRALINAVTAQDRRVTRYDQRLSKQLGCSQPQAAVLCVLLLRGPQTPGEIKGRTGRLYPFESLQEVNQTLHEMQTREEFPIIHAFPRQPGTKESRFGHCLGDEEPTVECATPTVFEIQPPNDLRKEVEELKKQIEALQQEFTLFKKQFE